MTDCIFLKESGDVAFSQKQYFDAVEYYYQAVEKLRPGDIQLEGILYLKLSQALLYIERVNESVFYCNRAIKSQPNNPRVYYHRANALMTGLRFKEAYSDYMKAYELSKDSSYHMLSHKAREAYTKQILIEDFRDVRIPFNDNNITNPYFKLPNFTLDYVKLLAKELDTKPRTPPALVNVILKKCVQHLAGLPNVCALTHVGEVVVVGDLHGQFQDLMDIFDRVGWPTQERPYIFNGGMVDRGSQGIEIIITLAALKMVNPYCVYWNRGSHETTSMNHMYGFEREVINKYSESVYDACTEFFNYLPLAHIINEQIFVVHSAPYLGDVSLAEVQGINRFCQPPQSGPFYEMLFADPVEGYAHNEGVVTYTENDTIKFLEDNGLDFIIRSHQVQKNGILEMHDGKVICLSSCPNYSNIVKNTGAVIILNFDENRKFVSKACEGMDGLPFSKYYPPMKFSAFGEYFQV